MNNLPFDKPGRFWRGNLHTHTTMSDGRLPVEAVCQLYQDAGYDFLAITDHFLERYDYPITDTRSFRTERFTTLIGAELHTGHTELGHLWHILAVGLPFDFARYPSGETGPEVARRAMDAGAFVAVAHPSWYGLTEADVLSLGSVHAIEVYNGTSVDHNDRADSWPLADVMLMRGGRYTTCATDDTHFNPLRHDFARGWVNVRSGYLDPDALMEALKVGHYYSSTGPSIFDIRLGGGAITVRCSPVGRIFITGYGSLSASVVGNGITSGEVDLAPFANSPFVRVTVRDAHGECAWSNPIWL